MEARVNVKIKQENAENEKDEAKKENIQPSLALSNLKVDALSLQSVIQCLYKAKRCVIVTGAGISVNGGIPDFRSADGLYNIVKTKYPQYSVKSTSGKDLFDSNLFRKEETRKLFYVFMAELREMIQSAKITPCHEFIKKVSDWNKLVRCYTQNIDCLEQRLGLCSDMTDKRNNKVVQLHGDLESLVCTLCQHIVSGWSEEHVASFKDGEAPACPSCHQQQEKRAKAGMRERSVGILRPNIVLYNEYHPKGDLIADFINKDASKRPDFLIVMGTSLKITGLKHLIKQIAAQVKAPRARSNDQKNVPLTPSKNSNTEKLLSTSPRVIFINKTSCSKEWHDIFDYQILGDADEAVSLLMAGVEQLQKSAKERQNAKQRKKAAKIELEQTQPRIDGYFKQEKSKPSLKKDCNDRKV